MTVGISNYRDALSEQVLALSGEVMLLRFQRGPCAQEEQPNPRRVARPGKGERKDSGGYISYTRILQSGFLRVDSTERLLPSISGAALRRALPPPPRFGPDSNFPRSWF